MAKWKICGLCAIMVVAVLCGGVRAFQSNEKAELQAMTGSGECGADGSNVTWELDRNGVLTISGTGAIADSRDFWLGWREFTRYIVEVKISDGVTNVPDGAFSQCDYLESVTLGNTVRSIGEEAFYACDHLTDFSGLGVAESIGESAFAHCVSLKEINLSGNLKTVGPSAFYGCGLTGLHIPDNVEEIGSGAFRYNGNLESVVVGGGVSFLDYGIFDGCESLNSVTIPSTVTAVDESCFYSCNKISDVYYSGTAAQWDRIRGGGADDLEYRAKKIHLECTGPDDATPMTVEVSDVWSDWNEVHFEIKSVGGIQNVLTVLSFYGEKGKFIGAYMADIRLPVEDDFYGLWASSVDTENAITVKVFTTDRDFQPLCPAATGNVEH